MRSLLDSAASLSDVEAMALTMSTVARSQRRLKAYGKTFVDLRKVKVEDGVILPVDDRSKEVRRCS